MPEHSYLSSQRAPHASQHQLRRPSCSQSRVTEASASALEEPSKVRSIESQRRHRGCRKSRCSPMDLRRDWLSQNIVRSRLIGNVHLKTDTAGRIRNLPLETHQILIAEMRPNTS